MSKRSHKSALGKLHQALKLNHGLTDCSKENSDLDSPRELPQFIAVYEGSH
jgi:hypothetical protein